MKKLAIIAVLSFFATPLTAMPVAPLQQPDDEAIVMVRKGGGSSPEREIRGS